MNSEKLLEVRNACFQSRRYLLLYLVFISLTFASTLSQKNFAHPKFEIIAFALMAVLGIGCITYYFLHDSSEELFKVAFVIILCFGIISAFVVPIMDVSDEVEHLTRAELTSQGELIPHWTGYDIGVDRLFNHTDGEFSEEINRAAGYETIQSMDFYNHNREVTVFDIDDDTDRINESTFIRNSAFEQNPFYGYLPQAIGVFIAKLLDLNVIWMLWLGRVCNLIFYAGIISLAVKITPKFKIPLIMVSCLPLTIYQAASVSIDAMILGLGLLVIAYFIYLCSLSEISTRHIIIFSALSLLLGLCKLPYLAFIFLLVFIPKDSFKNNYIYIFPCIAAVGLIGIIYGHYATPTLMHSWRSTYNYTNSTAQMNYLMNHPMQIAYFFKHIFTEDLIFISNGVFNFFNGKLGLHYRDNYVFITLCLQIFMAIVLLAYPKKDGLKSKTKIGALVVLLIVYIGTCFVQLLTWAYVGEMGLGICLRYFIPLFALVPLIVPHREYCPADKFDHYTMVFIIGFMASLILAFATKYY